MKEVFEVGLDIIKKIQETQSEKLEQTGHLVAKAFMDGHKFLSVEVDTLIQWQKRCMLVQVA